MPLPPRPHALVLGAHEDDVGMTEGLEGLTEQLSVGFLDLADDLPQRLPSFLAAYDAVVLGRNLADVPDVKDFFDGVHAFRGSPRGMGMGMKGLPWGG